MNIGQSIITNILLEKASIDWNNYLTPAETSHLKSKDDKIEAAEDIIYSDDFKTRYDDFHNDLQAKYNNSWTKPELVQDLADFVYKGNLIESKKSDDTLWKSQIDRKDNLELQDYLNRLYKKLSTYNTTQKSNEVRSSGFYDLINKITYVEDKLGIRPKIGRILH